MCLEGSRNEFGVTKHDEWEVYELEHILAGHQLARLLRELRVRREA